MPPRKKSLVKRLKAEKWVIKKGSRDEGVIEPSESKNPELNADTKEDSKQDFEIKEAAYKELVVKFTELNKLYKSKTLKKWEDKLWHDYIHKSREVNPLILPEVNTYLTDLDEDNTFDIKHVFKECHKSQQMCEDIKLALLECPEVDSKTLQSWLESIRNLQQMVRKKVEQATFVILRAANENLNEDSFNMEFIEQDLTKHKTGYTLCIWGNLSKNVRHKGMDVPSIGFSFELPPELLKINCAVRILHSSFDSITPAFCESAMPNKQILGELLVEDEFWKNVLENIYPAVEDSIVPQMDASTFSELMSVIMKQLLTTDSAGKPDVDKTSSAMLFTPPEEPEITIVDKAEYFVVGGLYHFELFQLPYQIVKSGCWVFTNWDEKVLKRIPFRTSIIPIRHPKPDMSPAIAAEFADSEIKRFDKEMCSAISVCLKLPEHVIFLEQPMPGYWVPTKKGFTTIGFFETKHDEDSGCINFKTNEFGIIGLLQRKYSNMPYQSWELISGSEKYTATLTITGMQVSVKIKISRDGCCIEEIEQDAKLLFSDSYSIKMSPDLLVKKLLSMGINIAVENSISQFIEVSSKNNELENWTYSCIAILSHEFNFYWSRWNMVAEKDQLVLKCSMRESCSEDMKHILLTPDQALEIKCTESNSKFSDEPVEGQKYCSDLYHLLIEQIDVEDVMEVDYEFSNNLFFLLSLCKPFSCS